MTGVTPSGPAPARLWPFPPLTTQIVGSYSKPQWLARHERMGSYDGSWWRPEAEVVQEAREDAALLAILEQERAGLDIVTDGEAQRTAYDRHFLAGLSGIDTGQLVVEGRIDEVGTRTRATSEAFHAHDEHLRRKPSVVGEIGWVKPVAVDELAFLRRHATRPVKAAIPGPLTLASRLADRFYNDEGAFIAAIAAALNQEFLALQKAGADVLQIDEPAFHTSLSVARRIGIDAIERVLEGIVVPVVVHVCYGYAYAFAEKRANPDYAEVLELVASTSATAISLEYEQPRHEPAILKHCGDKHVVLGLLDLSTRQAPTPDYVASRIRAALKVTPPERLLPSSDCGMWFLPRNAAYAKISALVRGTRTVRGDLGLLE